MTTIFLDTETTGLEPSTCSIIQLSGIIRNGDEEETFDFRIRPYRGETITSNATSKTGLTQDIIMQYPEQKEAYTQFIELMKKYRVGATFNEKAYIIGYNSDFDMRFLRSWFEFNGNTRFGWMYWWPDIDVARLAALYYMGRRGNIKSFKLVDVYAAVFGKYYENAHDSMADVIATKELFEFFTRKFLFEPMRIGE